MHDDNGYMHAKLREEQMKIVLYVYKILYSCFKFWKIILCVLEYWLWLFMTVILRS